MGEIQGVINEGLNEIEMPVSEKIFDLANIGLSAFVRRLWISGWLFKFFTRLLPVPTANVRGTHIKIIIPLHEYGVFQTFKTWEHREPETLDWIDSFEPNTVFFDVGASFGTETLYAALKTRGPKKIVSFDLDLHASINLALNIQINNIRSVDQYYLGLYSRSGFISASEHTNYARVPRRPKYDRISYKTWSLTIDEFIAITNDSPDYLKVDVDGAEGDIMDGARKTIYGPKLKSALVEVCATTRQKVVDAFESASFVIQREKAINGNTANIIFVR